MKENKLIAEFMGWEEIYKDASQLDYKFAKPNEIIYRRNIDDLEYHISWDWLMSVVDKLEGIETDNGYYEFRIQLAETKIVDNHFETWIEINEGDRFENTYLAVVEFIKEYNNNQKT